MSEDLNHAISLAKSGQKGAAIQLLAQILQKDPHNEGAWLWLVESIAPVQEKLEALREAVELNPQSPHLRKALAYHQKMVDQAKSEVPPVDSQPAAIPILKANGTSPLRPVAPLEEETGESSESAPFWAPAEQESVILPAAPANLPTPALEETPVAASTPAAAQPPFITQPKKEPPAAAKPQPSKPIQKPPAGASRPPTPPPFSPSDVLPPEEKRRSPLLVIGGIILAGVACLVIVMVFGYRYFNGALGFIQPPTATVVAVLPPTDTLAAVPTATISAQTPTTAPTATLTLTQTPAPLPTATPTPQIAETLVSAKDNMPLRLVPAGEFQMGSKGGLADEAPAHPVELSAFYMDLHEVTNKMYMGCVADGGCTDPVKRSSAEHAVYYGIQDYYDYPVIRVTWFQAQAYCTWAGRRLPTEAEWEKAARGADGRIFPWGDEAPTGKRANFGKIVGDTVVTDNVKIITGASPYGLMEMAGNVWEWVADWYNKTFYASSPATNPTGPENGKERVLRGGSFASGPDTLRTARRNYADPSYSDQATGFRCAVSADQVNH